MANNDDLNAMSDEELAKIAGVSLSDLKSPAQANPHADLYNMSDEELAKIAGVKLKPKEMSEADKVYSFLTGAAQSAVDTMLLPGNLFARGINKIAGKNIAPIADFNLSEEQIGGPAPSKPFQAAGAISGAFTTPVPGVSALSKAATLAKGGKVAQRLARVGDSALTGGGISAAYAANREGSDLGSAGIKGALLGAAIRGGFEAPGAAADLVKALIPIKPSATPQRIAEVRAATEGLPVDIGTAADIPFLRHIYKNVLPNVPFSGAAQNMQKVNDSLEEQAAGFLAALRKGKSAKDLPQYLADEVASNYEAKAASVGNKFKTVREQAADVDATVLPRTQQAAKQALADNQKLVDAGQNGFLNEADSSLLKRIAEASNAPTVTEFFNPATMTVQKLSKEADKVSFAIRDELRKQFSESARKHAKDSNQRLAKLYERLEDEIQADLEDALQNAGRSDLVSMWKGGRQEHAVDVRPYRDLRALKKAKDNPNEIHKLLMSEKGRKLFEHLSPEAQEAVQYRHLTKGKTKDSRAQKVISNFANLEEREQERLYGQNAAILKKLGIINDVAKEYRPILNKPQTGVQAANWLKTLGLLGAGTLIPGVSNTMGAALGGIAVPFVSNRAAKVLSSPKNFEMAAKLAANKIKKEPKLDKKIADKLTRAMAYEMSGKPKR